MRKQGSSVRAPRRAVHVCRAVRREDIAYSLPLTAAPKTLSALVNGNHLTESSVRVSHRDLVRSEAAPLPPAIEAHSYTADAMGGGRSESSASDPAAEPSTSSTATASSPTGYAHSDAGTDHSVSLSDTEHGHLSDLSSLSDPEIDIDDYEMVPFSSSDERRPIHDRSDDRRTTGSLRSSSDEDRDTEDEATHETPARPLWESEADVVKIRRQSAETDESDIEGSYLVDSAHHLSAELKYNSSSLTNSRGTLQGSDGSLRASQIELAFPDPMRSSAETVQKPKNRSRSRRAMRRKKATTDSLAAGPATDPVPSETAVTAPSAKPNPPAIHTLLMSYVRTMRAGPAVGSVVSLIVAIILGSAVLQSPRKASDALNDEFLYGAASLTNSIAVSTHLQQFVRSAVPTANVKIATEHKAQPSAYALAVRPKHEVQAMSEAVPAAASSMRKRRSRSKHTQSVEPAASSSTAPVDSAVTKALQRFTAFELATTTGLGFTKQQLTESIASAGTAFEDTVSHAEAGMGSIKGMLARQIDLVRRHLTDAVGIFHQAAFYLYEHSRRVVETIGDTTAEWHLDTAHTGYVLTKAAEVVGHGAGVLDNDLRILWQTSLPLMEQAQANIRKAQGDLRSSLPSLEQAQAMSTETAKALRTGIYQRWQQGRQHREKGRRVLLSAASRSWQDARHGAKILRQDASKIYSNAGRNVANAHSSWQAARHNAQIGLSILKRDVARARVRAGPSVSRVSRQLKSASEHARRGSQILTEQSLRVRDNAGRGIALIRDQGLKGAYEAVRKDRNMRKAANAFNRSKGKRANADHHFKPRQWHERFSRRQWPSIRDWRKPAGHRRTHRKLHGRKAQRAREDPMDFWQSTGAFV
ncbi:uncharacterized protein L969DRAFT_94152 [Mixia osmundae IAM 14324]|uniref:Uncharacterized protein n=1 Tax=Mixia osmundae (strain CBS 9802 / IAM 14324 / JCM 22182 / KY 12970) TaxID=764103 RepID=G7DVF9_MIXOS|nr:uncharacterized protein L969DRAFT_94152 [Mixia osmundae IAM 14324]KEI40347.1 hypothetical protein L969DRAFT_94152 [Mixia osmundae IAM 14324]GAA94569.1 hypothetical protein E5Q_01221 [Mixia osmundae IAM 14324]